MTEQQRAKAGGEEGANGEWYEGGKFISTTDHEKKRPGRVKGTRRVEVEPWKWEFPPQAGSRSLFQSMGPGVFTGKLETGLWGLIARDVTWLYYFQTPEAVLQARAEYQTLADRFNAGERWIAPAAPPSGIAVASGSTVFQAAKDRDPPEHYPASTEDEGSTPAVPPKPRFRG